MKRKVAICMAAAWLCAAFCGVGCRDKTYKENVKYYFDDVSFKRSKGLTMDDLRALVPVGRDFKSVDDFEDYIEDNLKTYTIVRQDGDTTERISVAMDIDWLKVRGDEFIVCVDGVEESYDYVKKGNHFLVEQWNFYFTDGEFRLERGLYFDGSGAEMKEFAIVYEFED
ncbi:MAG: hypothetical protein IKD47_04870 [Clostridia bacterium]|nr:hypothetical protein [Clostridia bacterium]